MKIQFAVNETDHVVFIKTSGIRDFEQIIKAGKDALMLADNHGFDKILVDHRQTVISAATAELYHFAQTMKAHGLTNKHRIAILFSQKADGEWHHQILEAGAAEQNVQIQAFDKVGEALCWLGVPYDSILTGSVRDPTLIAV